MKLEEMSEEVQAIVRANRTAFEQMLNSERAKIFNEHDLIPVGNTDPYEVYQAARYALNYLKMVCSDRVESSVVVKMLEAALKLPEEK